MSSYFFLSLRNEVLYPVLTDWIFLVDFVSLDSALCSTDYRPHFHASISSEGFTHTGGMHFKSIQYYEWLMLRNIKVRNMNLAYFVTNKLNDGVLRLLSLCRSISIQMQFCTNLIKILSSYVGVVNELDFNNCVDLNDEMLDSVLPFIKGVTKLCLIETKCTNASIQKLIQNCPNLTKLEIYYCDQIKSNYVCDLADAFGHQMVHFVPNENLLNQDVSYAIQKCHNIISLGLSHMHLEMSGVVAISICRQLVDLKTEFCELTDELVCTMVANLSLLQSLWIDSNPKITDVSLKKISQSCPVLRYLAVEGCSLITDVGVQAVAQNCSRLDRINLSFCSKLTEKALNTLYKECPLLQAVLFDGNLTNSLGSMKLLIQHRASHVQALELYGNGMRTKDEEDLLEYNVLLLDQRRHRHAALCVQWNYGALLNRSMLTQVFGLLPQLRRLFISKQVFNDKHADHLIARCPHIESLGIWSSDLSSDGLTKLLLHYSLQLTELHVADDEKVLSDALLGRLTGHLCNISILTLISHSPDVTDNGIITLFNHCPKVKKLRLTLPLVTNKAVVHVLTVCGSQLRILSLEGSTALTKHVIRELPSLCPVLWHLNIVRCTGIKNHPDCLMRLVQSCAQLETVLYGQDIEIAYSRYL